MTLWKYVKKSKTRIAQVAGEQNIHTQDNINLLQERLIEDPRISATENGLDISKSTFNRINKRDLKWHPNKMHVRKEIKNYKRNRLTERKSGFT